MPVFRGIGSDKKPVILLENDRSEDKHLISILLKADSCNTYFYPHEDEIWLHNSGLLTSAQKKKKSLNLFSQNCVAQLQSID